MLKYEFLVTELKQISNYEMNSEDKSKVISDLQKLEDEIDTFKINYFSSFPKVVLFNEAKVSIEESSVDPKDLSYFSSVLNSEIKELGEKLLESGSLLTENKIHFGHNDACSGSKSALQLHNKMFSKLLEVSLNLIEDILRINVNFI